MSLISHKASRLEFSISRQDNLLQFIDEIRLFTRRRNRTAASGPKGGSFSRSHGTLIIVLFIQRMSEIRRLNLAPKRWRLDMLSLGLCQPVNAGSRFGFDVVPIGALADPFSGSKNTHGCGVRSFVLIMKMHVCLRAAIAAVALGIAAATPARAALMSLTLSDGTHTESFTDNGSGLISENNLVFDKWTFTDLTAQVPAPSGSVNSDILLDLNWAVTAAANNKSALTITLTENDFGTMSAAAGTAGLSLQGTQSSSGGPGKVFQAGWINESEVVSQNTFTTGSLVGSTATSVSDLLGPDCFCEELVINSHSGKATSSDGTATFSVSTTSTTPLHLVAAPEPSYACAALGPVALIFASVLRRARRKVAAVSQQRA